MSRRSLEISPPQPRSPNPAHQPAGHGHGTPSTLDEHEHELAYAYDGLVPPHPLNTGAGAVSRSESAHSGFSASSAQREVAGIGYAGFDPSAPSPTQAYLDSFDQQPHQYPSSQLRSPVNAGGAQQYSPNTHSPAFETDRLGAGTNYSYPSRLQEKERYTDDRAPVGTMGYSDSPPRDYNYDAAATDKRAKRKKWLWIGIPLVLVAAAAIAVGVYFGTRKNGSSSNGGNGSSGAAGGGSGSGTGGSTGGGSTGTGGNGSNDLAQFGVKGSGEDGSMITTDLGVNFTYSNPFGGSWAQDPMNPYSVSGKAQSWSPAITEEWKWGEDIVRGVNLGGWLVTEPFIVPALYEAYQNATPQAVDEYTLSQALGDKLQEVMEEHYKTFITEEDFAVIAQYGLNWVRIPLGYWAIETREDEPYLQGVSWQYFLKAISWARKYGIRVLLDFHALPGSQNGWNHSGRSGTPGQAGAGVNFMYGAMGIANAERHLEQLRSLVQYISQDGIKDVVPMIGLVNEIQAAVVGKESMEAYYYRAYNSIRSITGYGAGNGPMIAIHEGFFGIADWDTFMSGADRLVLDQHPYLAFGNPNTETHASRTDVACSWAGGTNDTMNNWGVVIGGEWSNAVNNCGKWLNGVGSGNSYNSVPGGLGCDFWENWQAWNTTVKSAIRDYNLAQTDALRNTMFWTWRIGNSTEFGYATSPQWHYKLGVEQGWITADPREAAGFCRRRGAGGGVFTSYPASAIGSATVSPAIQGSATLAPWPPAVISPFITAQAQVALMPRLTQTGTPITMPTAAHPSGVTVGNGWAYPSDTIGAYVTISGCSYPNEYDAAAPSDLPTAVCAAAPAPETAAAAPTTTQQAATTPTAVAQTTATAAGGAVNPATPLGAATAR